MRTSLIRNKDWVNQTIEVTHTGIFLDENRQGAILNRALSPNLYQSSKKITCLPKRGKKI